MPFKSKSQMRACFAKKDPNWDCHKWAHETGSTKSLPERKKRKKNYGGNIDYSRKTCMKCGGKKKMQEGGCFDQLGNPIPCEDQQLQGAPSMAWQRPESMIPINPNLPVDPALTIPMQEEGDMAGYDIDPIRQRNNGDWVIDQPKRIDPFKALLGITGAKAGLSWLSGVIDRRRQRRYLQNQYSTLGQIDPIPVSNFQPTPYNLYARYGGSLGRYKNFTHPIYTNKAENAGFPMDDGRMKEGGKWIQKAVNPKHKGYCTPMTKSTCTPRRKALARTFKKHHGFHD